MQVMYWIGERVPYHSISMKYSGACQRWLLCKAATSLKQPASLAPTSTKELQSTSLERPPLYNGQLELAHRWLSFYVFEGQAVIMIGCWINYCPSISNLHLIKICIACKAL